MTKNNRLSRWLSNPIPSPQQKRATSVKQPETLDEDLNRETIQVISKEIDVRHGEPSTSPDLNSTTVSDSSPELEPKCEGPRFQSTGSAMSDQSHVEDISNTDGHEDRHLHDNDDNDDDDNNDARRRAGGNNTVLGRIASTLSVRRNRTRSESNVPPPPDGGVQAWIQVAAGWMVIFATWGYLNSFGAFQSYYTSTALPDQSPSAISWIGSIQTFLTTGLGAFTGRLLDAGYFRPTFAIGATIQVLGMFTMGISNNPKYWHLMVTQGVLTGLGGGILFTPSMALVATYFEKRRGLAIGLATTGNAMGGLVYPLLVRNLIPLIGFAWTVRTLAFVNLTFFGAALILLRTRLPPRRSGPLIEFKAFREPIYLAYVLGMLTFSRIASFGIERLGLSYSTSSVLVVIINGAGLPARVLMPVLADRLGPLNVTTFSAICYAITIINWFAVSNITGLYAFTAALGFTSGSLQSLMPTTIASITKHLNTVGTRLGMCFSVSSIASLTGPPLGGALQRTPGGFTSAEAWAGVAAMAAAGSMVSSRIAKVGPKLKKRC